MEKISALVDGELDEHQAQQLIADLRQQADLREQWSTFHLIGDALRGDSHLSADISQRVAQRLALEPTVLAPRRQTSRRAVTYALSAAASLAAVALVAWTALSTSNPLAPQSQMAQTQAPASIAAPAALPVSMPSQGNMNEYLLAHQGFSPSTAIQGVAPYIRSVSARQPAASR